MRSTFIKTLEELAQKDRRIFFITGDLGYSVIESFQKKFPRQFLNAGVAEQNMTGIAAGLALSGKIVCTYSIANFPSLRPLEQVRNDVCYHNANVKIVSVGSGFAYGALGSSHHATEDIAVMRSLPNMTVLCPADGEETGLATRQMIQQKGPCYLRLAKDPGSLYKKTASWSMGKAVQLREGKDVTLFSTGAMLKEVIGAVDVLEGEGISAGILHVHTVKPIDKRAIEKAAKKTKKIITVEEHNLSGGFGGAVAEVLAESGVPAQLKRIGIPDTFSSVIGDQEFLKQAYGLSVGGIVAQTKLFLKKAKK